MSLRCREEARGCAECGAPRAADQRYCLQCGARAGAPRVDPLGALGFVPDTGPAADGEASTPRPARRAPSRRLTAALAAATLGLGAVAGAALGPGPAPSVAAAPQRLVALVVDRPATATTSAGADSSATPPADAG